MNDDSMNEDHTIPVYEHDLQDVDVDSVDVELSQVLPIFPTSSKPCINVWMDKMSKGILTSTHFKEHWRIWVPNIYSPEPNGNCLGWSFDEDMAEKMLYNTLEEFICNGEPREVLQQLAKLENPPSVCGRFFKVGEPTYFCRECGMDPTCVLCVACFKESAHQNHKYKIATSSGGGCCDCGDPEAWKKEAFCRIHEAGKEAKETSGNKLPEDIRERATSTFEAVLQYCFELLAREHTPGLPADLRVKETDEGPLSLLATTGSYCTVLFNDETHTFEQVISTLARVIKCTQKEAIEFVTNIDRNGRAVVKCSDFQHCNELKSDIERFTSRQSSHPLKVLVVHAHVIAHQIFAMRLLGWLQQFISHCEGFRIIFSDVALNKKLPDLPIVDGILMRDSHLWKAARTAWHRLFISGMLMEYESKKSLAIVFTTNYGTVMKDFMKDDHDHSFSISSLSVQLFTVPTLAHYLIANHDVLFILLNTFISESSRRCNPVGKLEFERNTPHTVFKRAQYILCDLSYLLSSKPDTWTDELRKGFLQGMSLLMKLLWSMQGMDAVLRQVGQHMEYEPEWESAFNLHIKLSPVISLALEWCGSDRVVLIKAFRLVLKKLSEQPNKESSSSPGQLRELADHSATCIVYDVSLEPVSIHLPLSRFLAGLFLYLEKYNLDYQSSEFMIQSKLSPEQLIEPVLRAQAMISQVHAGMWRRNGYSLLNQLYFYHNVRCRTEMLDRDIILLQVGAALIESNEFLIHILNKYNLLNWADVDFETNTLRNPEEDSIRQTINLVEEFLGLLITIIGERHVPGVGQVTADDRLKKEIIQQLCIKPMSHSELNKTLPDGVHHETGLERVINDVANFKKPSQNSGGKGLYELKPELFAEYNVFFYHYTKEELSKSEESQRRRRKGMQELECCPPPQLPKLTETFSLVANLLQCDVMLHIMQTVLERSINLRARSFSEPQVHKIIHLIGYALQEQMTGNYPFLIFTERASKWRIYKLLEELSTSPRVDAHKDLVIWVLGKYREAAGSSIAEASQQQVENTKEPSVSTNSEEEQAKNSKEWRTQMAAQKRAKVMAQMAAMQKHFMKKNAKLFEEAAIDANSKGNERGSSMDLSESSPEAPVALGPRQTPRIIEEKEYTCLLCQEDQTVTPGGRAMVLSAFVQQSTVLCQTRNDPDEKNSLYLSSRLGASPHTSTCGHVMHASCWEKYFDNVLAKENRRPYRLRQPASFDVEKHEYLCPLCECLSNTVLPLLPSLATLQSTETKNRCHVDFDTWLNALTVTLDCKSKSHVESDDQVEVHDKCRYCESKISDDFTDGNITMLDTRESFGCPIRRIQGILGKEVAHVFDVQTITAENKETSLSDDLKSMVDLFAQATYTKGLGVDPHTSDARVPLLAWKSTAYTIHAIEFLLRDSEKPLLGALSSRQRDSLECLARISAVLGSTWPSSNSSSSSGSTSTGANEGDGNYSILAGHAMTLLTTLLDNSSEDCITDWDPFGILVPLVVTLPSLFSRNSGESPPVVTGSHHEIHVLRLVLVGLVVKILITSDFTGSEVMDVDALEDEGYSALSKIITILGVETGGLTLSEVWRRVKIASLPFLRCCVLYFHYITDVPAPVELTVKDGDTYENIMMYLGLETSCEGLLESEGVRRLAKNWVEHPRARLSVGVKEPLRVNGLVKLPEDYSELINTVSLFTCPNSDKEDSRNPTMCLVCGEMLCSQTYCCQTELNKIMVGACTYHASKCGTGVGIFLRVRECEILFLRSPNRGAFACPPYLDEYGETDQGLRRGNPLKLCREKYKQLNQMWLGHGLHEAVSRAIESSSTLMSTQWQHL
ncbi:E3 ubiquitin-protein ligase UBR2 [Fopius arisanus]|uniref:E3 ubiquitin-protein ligase n=2 Tax=Fopius arisanus TaxID=64838 RepID=A0A9R1T3N3_9HYME|nr:PREDICTED: E3 ubiquitin-protein ligase UBR2 [Fopius arisanus]XP_011302106.1 PREDICTED: E3 ubiquitin-protein ligase UBR2 [Fopius arisanus]